jgi:putative transposase
MGWARILAHVTGTLDQDLLAWNEYLATVREHQSAFQLVFQDAVFAERATLGEIGHRLGRKVLAEVATV